MVRLRLHDIEADCRVPEGVNTDVLVPGNDFLVRPDEKRALIQEGVWRGDESDWARQAADGTVWAGTEWVKGRKIAQVRAKNARRLAVSELPRKPSRLVHSFTLAEEEAAALDALEAAISKEMGEFVSRSYIMGVLALIGKDDLDSMGPRIVARMQADRQNLKRTTEPSAPKKRTRGKDARRKHQP